MKGLTIKTTFAKSLEGFADGFAVPIAEASTAAIKRAGEAVKARGRAKIASEGFGTKWQNALRVKYFPKALIKPVISAAAFIYHKIDYAVVFDKPTTVAGRRLMWIPISGAMKSFREARSPSMLRAKGVELFSLQGTRTPLLAAKIKGSKRTRAKNVSLTKLKRGTAGKRGTEQTVPLFFGVPSVSLRKEFGIEKIATQERNNLGTYYNEALEVD